MRPNGSMILLALALACCAYSGAAEETNGVCDQNFESVKCKESLCSKHIPMYPGIDTCTAKYATTPAAPLLPHQFALSISFYSDAACKTLRYSMVSPVPGGILRASHRDVMPITSCKDWGDSTSFGKCQGGMIIQCNGPTESQVKALTSQSQCDSCKGCTETFTTTKPTGVQSNQLAINYYSDAACTTFAYSATSPVPAGFLGDGDCSGQMTSCQELARNNQFGTCSPWKNPDGPIKSTMTQCNDSTTAGVLSAQLERLLPGSKPGDSGKAVIKAYANADCSGVPTATQSMDPSKSRVKTCRNLAAYLPFAIGECIKASDVFSTKVTCPPATGGSATGGSTTGGSTGGSTTGGSTGGSTGMGGGTIFFIILLIILGLGGIAIGVCVKLKLGPFAAKSGLADSIYTAAPDGDY